MTLAEKKDSTAYCPTCRTRFASSGNPPYSVMHRVNEDGTITHLHPITLEEADGCP